MRVGFVNPQPNFKGDGTEIDAAHLDTIWHSARPQSQVTDWGPTWTCQGGRVLLLV
jgi:hypothetical protein